MAGSEKRRRRWINNEHVRSSRRWQNPESQRPNDRFYVKSRELFEVIRRASWGDVTGYHSSMVSSWGTSHHYCLLGGWMREDRLAPGKGRSGVWFDSLDILRFGLYQLKVEQPSLFEGEVAIPTLAELKARIRFEHLHYRLIPLQTLDSSPTRPQARRLLARGADPHLPLDLFDGITAFEAAMKMGRPDLAALYAAAPRTVPAQSENLPSGKSPALLAVEGGELKLVKLALASHGGPLQEVSYEDESVPLFEVARRLHEAEFGKGGSRTAPAFKLERELERELERLEIEEYLLREVEKRQPQLLGSRGEERLEFFDSRRRRAEARERLAKLIERPRLPLGDELLQVVAEWGQLYIGQGASAGTCSLRVGVLKWALKGRAKEFVSYAEQSSSAAASGALAAVNEVYEYAWPHSMAGYVFGALWGWLQLELEKPGESGPPTPSQQMETLERGLRELGIDAKRVQLDSFGAVTVDVDVDSKQRQCGCDQCFGDDAEEAWAFFRTSVRRMRSLIHRSHFDVDLWACPECGQRFVHVLTELMRFDGGEEPLYRDVVPLSEAEFDRLADTDPRLIAGHIGQLGPGRRHLRVDWPAGQEEPRASWDDGAINLFEQ